MVSRPRLSPREKAAQMICAAFRFEDPDFERIQGLVRQGIGGICLYGGSVFETGPFVNSLQNMARFPLLVASDYEKGAGHQVSRATLLPAAMALGAAGSDELAELAGKVTAREARALGVNWIFAPVLDLQVRAENPIINVRSFGSDPALVVRLGRAFAKGCRAGPALSCGKHFPGHGDVIIDSHLELPRVPDHRASIGPFADLAADLDSIMSAHLLVESLDPTYPVSMSAAAIGMLRRELKFEGLIVTDALIMGGITKGFPERGAVLRAARAGNDVILYPADPEAAIDTLEKELEEEIADRAVDRILAAKQKLGLFRERIVGPEVTERVVGTGMHLDAARRIAEASVTRLHGEFPVKRARLAVAADMGHPGALGVFTSELDRRGVLAPDSDVGILALSAQPRAFSGRIAMDPAHIEKARKELDGVKRLVAVSFGSPYVHGQVTSDAALCVYDESEASQRAAARALVGEIPAAGRLPVRM